MSEENKNENSNEETSPTEETESVEESPSDKKVELPVFFGRKAGMTRIFSKEGYHVPVSVIELIPNAISQVKTTQKDGYEAYQIAYGRKREKLLNNPLQGHLKRTGLKGFFHFTEEKVQKINPDFEGKTLSLKLFTEGSFVDVTGISKGKGFQGVMKRYGFKGGPAAHGSHFHRTPGAVGNRATPGKIFKRKKLPGHMGCETRTIQNIQIVEINEKGYILLRGSIPGSKNSFVRIARSIKKGTPS